MDPLSQINTRRTIQTEQASPLQVENSAGGYSFQVDKMQQALRFLILGSQGGTYYAGESKLTKDNAKVIIDLAARRGTELVDLIVDVSTNGRAAKQNQGIFALAICSASPDLATRQAALKALPAVCRTGTSLFQFAGYVEQFRGWGRALRTAVGDWYLNRDVDNLAYQAVKYRQRDGWSHRDLLRLSHPYILDIQGQGELFDWITKPDAQVDRDLPRIVQGYLMAQAATTPKEWATLVDDFKLPWEALPSQALKSREVWDALLPHMGIGAMVRNLGRLTSLGNIGVFNVMTNLVTAKLTDPEEIRRGRLHPLNILTALMTYQSGHGFKGSLTWDPASTVVGALDEAFYLAFGELKPANKSTLVALDVSGSMGWTNIGGSPMTPREASAAMAMTVVRTEPTHGVVGFCDTLRVLPITPSQRLDDVLRTISGLPFGGTDCALPIVAALQNKWDIDTFIVYTDNETWCGGIHPHQALEQYRQIVGHDARLIVNGMASNNFSIADPQDEGMLDVCGFDTAAPELIRSFSAREF